MASIKVCYIVSKVHKSLAFEWIANGLKEKFQLTFILLNSSTSPLEEFLMNQGVNVYRINYRGKKDFIGAFIKTAQLLFSNKPEVVHAHLLDAQLIGLLAARLLGIKKRIYTRHNSNFHHVYHRKGIVLDKLSNWLATKIISISRATDITLLELENVSPNKVKKISHGFDLQLFKAVSPERILSIRKKWNIKEHQPVVGVIARHIEWKGIQFIIPAFRKFLNDYPTAVLVLANATGPFHKEIMKLLEPISSERIVIIPFEEDVAALYAVFDVYIHTPIDPICEAFGQTYVESLAAGIPSVFTLSGIASEFIVSGRNALVVNFKNSEEIYSALTLLFKDAPLRIRLIENGKQDVISRFEIKPMLDSLTTLYAE